MASTVICQKPAVEYYTLSTQQPEDNTTPPCDWDTSPYTDPILLSDDSFLGSPTTPDITTFPQFTDLQRQVKPTIKSEEVFDFGTFEDWMRWDEPTEPALSPTTEFFSELKTEPVSPDMNRLELQGGVSRPNQARTDDTVMFVEDPVNEEPLFQSSLNSSPLQVAELPLREGLYSTPLSWSRPSLGQMQNYNGILTPQEEKKLRDIAMPPNTCKQESYPASPTSEVSPEPAENKHKRRKPSVEEDDEEDEQKTSSRNPPVKKTAHNMIEKRYRTNLNDKIAALRDSVPSLRVISKAKSRAEEDEEEDLQGLTPAHKLNKATVLSKATEYIAHLEKRNKYLARENAALKSRVDAFEILVMARQPQQLQQQPQQPRGSMGGQRSQSWLN